MAGGIEFTVTFKKPGGAADDDVPAGGGLRLVVLADLSGRGTRAQPPEEPLAQRRLLRIDPDTFDRALARIAPRLELPVGPGSALAIDFHRLEDFHPDALFERLPVFQGLAELRRRLQDPATFEDAARALGHARAAAAAPPPAEDDAASLERLLGRKPSPAARPDALMGLLERVVGAHVTPTEHPDKARLVAAVDAAASSHMRSVLHHPAFQALEAAWRGVHGLVSNVELGEDLSVLVLDATHDEIVTTPPEGEGQGGQDDVSGSALARALAAGSDTGTLLVVHVAFAATLDDVAALGRLAALGRHLGAPVLAEAAPSLVGCTSFAGQPQASELAALTGEVGARLEALRRTDDARWLGLAAPRVLLRAPYGRQTDPIDAFSFEELEGARDPERYLWGSPALAAARLIAEAFATQGEGFDPGRVGPLRDLPTHAYVEDGDRHLQPVAEAVLNDRAVVALLDRGVMPFQSARDSNSARLARVQSIALPAAALAGPWSAR